MLTVFYLLSIYLLSIYVLSIFYLIYVLSIFYLIYLIFYLPIHTLFILYFCLSSVIKTKCWKFLLLGSKLFYNHQLSSVVFPILEGFIPRAVSTSSFPFYLSFSIPYICFSFPSFSGTNMPSPQDNQCIQSIPNTIHIAKRAACIQLFNLSPSTTML